MDDSDENANTEKRIFANNVKGQERIRFPSPEWDNGFRCAVDCYTELLHELLRDLTRTKHKIKPSILNKFKELMHQNRMEIYDEYYCGNGFSEFNSPFIRVNTVLSDKKNTVIEWYDPKRNKK